MKDYYERNKINTFKKEHLYKRRQTIVEHPYGTIKRQWSFSYIITKKGIARAASDVGFMFIAYNLRRIANILTSDVIKEYLRILLSSLLRKVNLTWLKNTASMEHLSYSQHSGTKIYRRHWLKLNQNENRQFLYRLLDRLPLWANSFQFSIKFE